MNETEDKYRLLNSRNVLDPSIDGFKLFSKIILLSGAVSLITNPESVVIGIIDYLKLPPGIVVYVPFISAPIILAMIFAQVATRLLYMIIAPILLIIFLLAITAPFIVHLAGTLILLKILSTIFNYNQFHVLKTLGKNSASLSKNLISNFIERFQNFKLFWNVRFFNRILFGIILAVLFSIYLWDNPLSQTWDPRKNKRIELVANLHYYCQLTSGYNEANCNIWKEKRREFPFSNM